MLIQLFILIGVVHLMSATLMEKIWLGHSRDLILFALIATFSINTIWRFVARIGESIRDTVNVQINSIVLTLVYLICTILLIKFHLINIKALFIVNVFIYIAFSIIYGFSLYKRGNVYSQNNEKFENVIIEYKSYCLPLIIASFVGFFYSFADYWFLQKFGGSAEQGYYAIGARLVSLSLIAAASIISIFWKEIAEAFADGNMDRVRFLYIRIGKSIYFCAAFLSCLLLPFSKEIIFILLGSSFEHAWVPFSIMLLYPIHQTLGQINLTMLQATSHTKTLSVISILFMAISIITSYFLLAPKSLTIPGLNLGSAGLSLKMVIVQIFEVNVLLFFNSKYIKIPFDWKYQFNVLFLLISLGFLIKYFSSWILNLFIIPHIILVMAFSGILYLMVGTSLVYYFPSIAGINRTEMNKIIKWVNPKHNL